MNKRYIDIKGIITVYIYFRIFFLFIKNNKIIKMHIQLAEYYFSIIISICFEEENSKLNCLFLSLFFFG